MNQKGVNIAAIDEAISYVHTLSFESDMSAALRNLPHKGKFKEVLVFAPTVVDLPIECSHLGLMLTQ